LVRKVLPLRRALAGLEAWINGRKGYQGELRAGLPLIEAAEGRVKVNPLAGWRKRDIDAYFERHDLPRHPLEADGFRSIGCIPCTDRVAAAEGHRAGRWRGIDKSECGIHLPPPGAARLGRAGAAASAEE
jgi:phosphoadenosine phosphosulfate reductase